MKATPGKTDKAKKPAAKGAGVRPRRSAKSRVTIREVAVEAGVSIGAVSDIVNRGLSHNYAAATQDRVRAAMDQLGYRPDRAAQALRRGRSDTVGVMLSRGLENPYYGRLFHEILVALERYHLSAELMVFPAGDPKGSRRGADWLIGKGVDALIVGPLYYWDEHILEDLRSLKSGACPIVTFGAVRDEADMHHVLFEDESCGRIGAEYLIGNGHRRIAYLGAYAASEAEKGRGTVQEGVERVLKSHAMLDRAWFIEGPDNGRFEECRVMAEKFAHRWLDADPATRPTAVMCKNDQMAITALSIFHEFGIKVPAQLSVIGYDNVPESEFIVPSLTTIDNAIVARVASVAERVSELLEIKHLRAVHAPAIAPALIPRRSVLSLGGQPAGG